MEFLDSKKLIFLFLIFLLLIDFFIIGKIDEISRKKIGYPYFYPLTKGEEQLLYQRYGWPRIVYNFSHFFQFWLSPPPAKNFRNLKEFLYLDVPPSNVFFNILHFFAFLIFAIILLLFFRLNVFLVLFIGLFFNIFHEYIAEGIYIDPSFNDLWTNLLGTLVGSLIGIILIKKL
ncbi:MAG: hypothetical protein ACK413_01800 [Patescibacteria group bacterium]